MMTLNNVLNRVINLSRVLPWKKSGSRTLADFSSADPRGLLLENLDTMATIKHFASLLNFKIFSLTFVGWFFFKIIDIFINGKPKIQLSSTDQIVIFRQINIFPGLWFSLERILNSRLQNDLQQLIYSVFQAIVNESNHWFVSLLSLEITLFNRRYILKNWSFSGISLSSKVALSVY